MAGFVADEQGMDASSPRHAARSVWWLSGGGRIQLIKPRTTKPRKEMRIAANHYSASKSLLSVAAGLCFLASSVVSQSAQIYWTDWTSSTVGSPSGGTASGAIIGLGISVSYSGEVNPPRGDGAFPSWGPTSTFSGGFVSDAPSVSSGSIGFSGGSGVVDTITFSQPVVNPVIAIWSLGNVGGIASMTFQTSQAISIECGGPSAEYPWGGSIYQTGNTIYGEEGSGVIEFHGTFTQISWIATDFPTTSFTVGAPTVVPEPTTSAIMLLGLLVCRWQKPKQGAWPGRSA
jgi:hypothetical protein